MRDIETSKCLQFKSTMTPLAFRTDKKKRNTSKESALAGSEVAQWSLALHCPLPWKTGPFLLHLPFVPKLLPTQLSGIVVCTSHNACRTVTLLYMCRTLFRSWRTEHFCFSAVGTVLQDQRLCSGPSKFSGRRTPHAAHHQLHLALHRDPPDVASHRETVAAKAHIRQCDPLSYPPTDDPP